MKSFYIVGPLLILSFFFSLLDIKTPSKSVSNPDITLCASSPGLITPGADGKYIPLVSGWGDLDYKISTKKDSAQRYFNQGLSFYYGYHFSEALASFKEASRIDPSGSMSYWGQALAMGPFYNTYVYKMTKEVPQAVASMIRLSSGATEKEKDLINALQKRYSNDLTNADRKLLDRNYAMALASLIKKYPDDDNIKALYIDAVMLEHKWDFWSHDGVARPWTSELITLSEGVLKKSQHPAILHYYIHLTEASRQPDRALASADILKDKLPGIPHMVHMSSHMYQRNGLYAKGVKVNDDASSMNNQLDDYAPGLNIGKDKSIHYYAVQSYCAMTAGMYRDGIRIYDRARNRQSALIPVMEKETYAQFVYMMPVIARVRLGKWDEVLQSPAPNVNWKYAYVLDRFAKGLAQIHNKDLKAAKQSLSELNEAMKDSLLSVRLMPFNSPMQSCRIASGILTGEILFEEGKFEESVSTFKSAIDEEDKMVYREPQDWLIPARQYLGAYLLKMNKFKEAEAVYKEDLMMNPGNGWSSLGLSQSLDAQGKSKEALKYKEKYTKAFEVADVKPIASAF